MTDWFESLKSIVNRHEPADDPQALPRAAAVLLVEMAVTDEGGERDELATIHSAIQKVFDLDRAELDALMEQAHEQQRESVSMHEFTHLLRTGLEPGERAELVEWLWRVAYADGHLDRHEEHLVRRLADLLGVPHREFIRRKHLAADQS